MLNFKLKIFLYLKKDNSEILSLVLDNPGYTLIEVLLLAIIKMMDMTEID